jgi:hypothetical protein
MKPATPKTEPSPSTQLRKAVFGGSLMFMRLLPFGKQCLPLFVSAILSISYVGQTETQPSDQYFQVQLNFAVTNFHFNAEGQAVPYRHYVFPMRCVAGKTRWLIETKFSPNAVETYYCDGTNIFRIERIVSIDKASVELLRKRYGVGPNKLGIGDSVANAPVELTITPGICPWADAGGNTGWLIYCSSAYLNQPGRLIPLPGALIPAVDSSFGWKDTTTRFKDDLALPESIELRASLALLEKAPFHPSIQREGRRPEEIRSSLRSHFIYPEHFRRFTYRVEDSTNFFGWNIPLQVVLEQFEPDRDGKPALASTMLGTVTALNKAEEPRNPVVPGADYNVLDFRFRHPYRLVDEITYHLTNGIVRPVSDPTLQKIYQLRVQRAPIDPVIRAKLGIYGFYAVLLLVPAAFMAVHYWRKRCRTQSN